MLSKLKILAFKDEQLRSKVADYSLQINPDSYSHSHPVTFACNKGTDTAGTILKFSTHPHQGLKFDFVIDGTGVVPGVKSVTSEIKKFQNVVYNYQGKIHSPYYLKVLWGGLAFKCMLSSLDITYQMFDPSGRPLRAKLSANFEQYQTPEELARRADKKSADLTHSDIVTAGTTLPLMSYQVYDRNDLYVQLARFNDMNDLMHLREGSEVRFPPALE